MSFVHLHNHSHYSLLDGAQHIKTMVKKAKELNMQSLALTDHGNMFGAIEFYKACVSNDIKPIIGMEAYIVGQGSLTDRKRPDGTKNKTYHLVLLCKDRQGYENLCKLSSISYVDGFYYKPRIDKHVLKKYSKGLIGLTACLGGEVTNAHLRGDEDYARTALEEYLDIFGQENFYLEIQRHGMKEDFAYDKNYELAKSMNLNVVATNDCHYTEKTDWDSHDILICMQGGKSFQDVNRMRYEAGEFYLRSPEEMRDIFKNEPELCDATLKIAEQCNLEIEFGNYKLPIFSIPEKEGQINADEYLKRKTMRGLENRYKEVTNDLIERAEYELKVIKDMGFAAYFLIVMDFIEAARGMNIPVGLGRGSAAGSIVAFATGITSVDPIKYNLLFERFLNPERVSMPDVDIDFCMRRREEVIEYVRKKYGEKNVCQIITYGTLASKNAIKDVARVLDIPFDKANQITKLIPVNQGKPMGVTESFEKIPELIDLLESNDPIYKDLAKHASVLEGVAKSTGIHAAGVIIAPDDISKFVPICKNSDGVITTQYSMTHSEEIGLLKMDFLGLRTLTVIDDAEKMIRKIGPEYADFNVENIVMDDLETFKLYGQGDTVGIFQFESKGMQEYLRKLKPSRVEDLLAMNALYRPGPMQFIDDFIDRKHGRKVVEYLNPMLETILEETYGIIVYQEQVMKIVSDLGGFSLGEADIVRRAMGKKKLDVMQAYKEKFVQQAKDINQIDESISSEIYEMIVKFASYGFNKSHSAAYSILSYQTAYLKAHFPAQFMASIMTSEINSPDRIVIYMEECKRIGLKVIPPDINISYPLFSAPDDKTIAFGMQAIKNVGLNALETIVEAREEHGKFSSIFEVIEKVDSKVINKKVLESLTQAGALDSLEGNRAQKYASIETMSEFIGQLNNRKTDENQFNLFGEKSDEAIKISYPKLMEVEDWSPIEKLTKEKELLGFYVSGHPLARFQRVLNTANTIQINQPDISKNEQKGRLGGIITSFRSLLTKKGDKMAFAKIENYQGYFEAVIFPKAYQEYHEICQEGNMALFMGKLQFTDSKDVKIIVDDVLDLEQAETTLINEITIKIDLNKIDKNSVVDLNKILHSEIGDTPVYFEVYDAEIDKYIKMKSSKYKINANLETIDKIKTILSEDDVLVD
jgi:DNA polymerase III subunit alpha